MHLKTGSKPSLNFLEISIPGFDGLVQIILATTKLEHDLMLKGKRKDGKQIGAAKSEKCSIVSANIQSKDSRTN